MITILLVSFKHIQYSMNIKLMKLGEKINNKEKIKKIKCQ